VTHQESVRSRCELTADSVDVRQCIVSDSEERDIRVILIEDLPGKAFDALAVDPDGNPYTFHLCRDALATLLQKQPYPVGLLAETLTAIVFKYVRDVVDGD
jgi:hypothetical protein